MANRVRKILIVDDEPLMLRMYQRIFTEANGFSLESAVDGEEGLKMIKEIKPVMVLLDVLMPKLHGIQVLERMKEDKEMAKIPVIMLTNLDEENRMSKAIELGAQGYLIKSDFKPEEILKKTKEVLKQFNK